MIGWVDDGAGGWIEPARRFVIRPIDHLPGKFYLIDQQKDDRVLPEDGGLEDCKAEAERRLESKRSQSKTKPPLRGGL